MPIAVNPTESRRWRLSTLTTSPHRLCFFWAGALWVVWALWWALAVLGATGTSVPGAVVDAYALHALGFTLGWLPLFISGFAATAGPQWVRGPPVAAKDLRAGVAAFVSGWAICAAGVLGDLRIAAAGLALVATGLAAIVVRLAALTSSGDPTRRSHLAATTAALGLMVLCLASAAFAVATTRSHWLAPIARMALWSVVTVFIVVSHRMLPFFGDGAFPIIERHWPDAPLWGLVSVPLVQGVLPLLPMSATSSPALRWAVSAHLALAAAVSLRLTLRWWGKPALRQTMLRHLFIALLWWNVALVLGTVATCPGVPADWSARLQGASLHAVTLGYLGGTALAMLTRVSAARDGRPIAFDAFARVLHGGLQVAVMSRLAASLWPAFASVALPLAAMAWLGVAAGWWARHARWLGLHQGRAAGARASLKAAGPVEPRSGR